MAMVRSEPIRVAILVDSLSAGQAAQYDHARCIGRSRFILSMLVGRGPTLQFM